MGTQQLIPLLGPVADLLQMPADTPIPGGSTGSLTALVIILLITCCCMVALWRRCCRSQQSSETKPGAPVREAPIQEAVGDLKEFRCISPRRLEMAIDAFVGDGE